MKAQPKKQTNVSKEVAQHKQAEKKFISAMGKVEKLQNSPVIRDFMKMQDAPKQLSEQEKNKDRIGNLSDKYVLAQGYIQETLELLGEITGHKLDLPNIDSTLNELILKSYEVDKIVREVFEINGFASAEKEEEQEAA